MKTTFAAIAAAGTVLSVGSAAFAGPVLTYRFDRLNGGYTGNTGGGTFSAVADNSPGLRTQGSVTRVDTAQTASYAQGFYNPLANSDYRLILNVFGIGVNTAFGNGSFTVTDSQGDTITGSVSGSFFTPGFGVLYFNGVINSVTVNNTSGDNTFDGPSGGSFAMNTLPSGLSGALVELTLGIPNFFSSTWANNSSQVTAQLVPTPGAAVLLGLAGLVAGRRRR